MTGPPASPTSGNSATKESFQHPTTPLPRKTRDWGLHTAHGMLRHSNVHTTLQLYSHGRSQDRLDAQGTMLDAFFTPQEATVQ